MELPQSKEQARIYFPSAKRPAMGPRGIPCHRNPLCKPHGGENRGLWNYRTVSRLNPGDRLRRRTVSETAGLSISHGDWRGHRGGDAEHGKTRVRFVT